MTLGLVFIFFFKYDFFFKIGVFKHIFGNFLSLIVLLTLIYVIYKNFYLITR